MRAPHLDFGQAPEDLTRASVVCTYILALRRDKLAYAGTYWCADTCVLDGAQVPASVSLSGCPTSSNCNSSRLHPLTATATHLPSLLLPPNRPSPPVHVLSFTEAGSQVSDRIVRRVLTGPLLVCFPPKASTTTRSSGVSTTYLPT